MIFMMMIACCGKTFHLSLLFLNNFSQGVDIVTADIITGAQSLWTALMFLTNRAQTISPIRQPAQHLLSMIPSFFAGLQRAPTTRPSCHWLSRHHHRISCSATIRCSAVRTECTHQILKKKRTNHITTVSKKIKIQKIH